MRYILNGIYLTLLFFYLPILAFQRFIKGKKRPGLWGKIVGQGPTSQIFMEQDDRQPVSSEPSADDPHRCILFHAVSLGEIQAIRGLVNEFQKQNPDRRIVVSTTTQTGLDAARKAFQGIEVCLLPFDFSWAMKRFLKNLAPEQVVLAELEIWPNLVAECRRRKIPLLLVNARLSQRSFKKYARFSFFFQNVFRSFSAICCQNDEGAARFEKLGVDVNRITVSGNLKYDDLLVDRENPVSQQFRQLIQLTEEQSVFLAGSTQSPEEVIAIEAYLGLRDSSPDLRLLICPRHPERFQEVARILENRDIPYTLRSQLGKIQTPGQHNVSHCERVVLLDCVGELKHWWAIADMAFVGGSFGDRGGQNMMEPVAFGLPVCFGPYTRNFAQEVRQLLAEEAAIQLQNPAELTDFLNRCLREIGFASRLTQNARALMNSQSKSNMTAWHSTLQVLHKVLDQGTSRASRQAA